VYDLEQDWSALSAECIERHISGNDDPNGPPVADRWPAQMMQRSGFFDVAPTLGATGGHRGWNRREDVFWTNRPDALCEYK
jgi:hypothetical protein